MNLENKTFKEILELIEGAQNAIARSKKYGDDMKSSKEACINDAQTQLDSAIQKMILESKSKDTR